jgi:hypothetical protein
LVPSQRQLADAQTRLNTQRAASADAADGEGDWGGAGDSVLDLLREQVFPMVIPTSSLYMTLTMISGSLSYFRRVLRVRPSTVDTCSAARVPRPATAALRPA